LTKIEEIYGRLRHKFCIIQQIHEICNSQMTKGENKKGFCFVLAIKLANNKQVRVQENQHLSILLVNVYFGVPCWKVIWTWLRAIPQELILGTFL
jgi:hypothetical protein